MKITNRAIRFAGGDFHITIPRSYLNIAVFPLFLVPVFVAGCVSGAVARDVSIDTADVANSDVADAVSDAATDTGADVSVDAAAADSLADPGSDVTVDTGNDAADVASDVIGDADSTVVPSCPVWSLPSVAGNIDGSALTEASGLASSRVHPRVLWSHNDSGGNSSVYATVLPDVSGTGSGVEPVTAVSEYPLAGVSLTDCEDIATGPFAGISGDALFLADVGDNTLTRQLISVYVFAEPAVLDNTPVQGVKRVDATYPDGPHDCESFFVDPLTGDMYFVVKETAADKASVFVLTASRIPSGPNPEAVVLETVGSVPLLSATGADISSDGRKIVIRGYWGGLMYFRKDGQSVEAALDSVPCELPAFSADPYLEGQGEAIAFDPEGQGFFTVSESYGQTVQNINYTSLN